MDKCDLESCIDNNNKKLFNTEVFYQQQQRRSSSYTQLPHPPPIFVIDLTENDGDRGSLKHQQQQADEEEGEEEKMTRAPSTSSLPSYRSLISSFLFDAPPTYTEAVGKSGESAHVEVSTVKSTLRRICCCCQGNERMTKYEIIIRLLPLITFIVIFIVISISKS